MRQEDAPGGIAGRSRLTGAKLTANGEPFGKQAGPAVFVSNTPDASVLQDEVIGFLSRPGSYGLFDGAVERVETHCSMVFLTTDRAYKLKRAIRYASLDYTTRASREAACRAELVLNRRTAPDLYLHLQIIGRAADGALTFDETEQPLDYVVVMRRFNQADLFDQMLEADRLTVELMRKLGQVIARFHMTAARMPNFGGRTGIARVIQDNARELTRIGLVLDGGAVDTLAERTRATLDDVAALLEARRQHGGVRRCHGDLRLANICLFSGQPTLFDCIEFSEEIGCIDVLYDLAFLLMDLELRGRGDLGNIVFNSYLDIVGETDGLRALPLFLALRAATRSYALAGNAARQSDPALAALKLASARQHLVASAAFLHPAAPCLVLIGGENSQSRLALAMALAGRLPPAPGACLLRLAGSAEPWGAAAGLLSAGCSVIMEGMFDRNAEQHACASVATGSQVPPHGIWLGPLPEHLDRRLWRPIDPTPDPLAASALAAPLLAEITGQV